MPSIRPPYPAEFRRRMVDLVRAGRSPEELAGKFEPTAQSIRNWVAQSERDAGRREDGLTSAGREELRRLRRENKSNYSPYPVFPGDLTACTLARDAGAVGVSSGRGRSAA